VFIGLLMQRMMEVAVTTGLLELQLSRAKLQSNHHHQQTNIQFFTGQMPFLSPNQHCVKALKGKYHIPWTCLPKLTWGSSNFVFDH